MTRVTTHVLDTASGVPAAGIAVSLHVRSPEGGWQPVASGETNADGRIVDFPEVQSGLHNLVFTTTSPFFPEVTVTFAVTDEPHLHVPLLISPYGYSTYRGS